MLFSNTQLVKKHDITIIYDIMNPQKYVILDTQLVKNMTLQLFL